MKNFFIVSFVACCLLALPYGFVYGTVRYECRTYEVVTGKPTKMGALTCYVNDGGQWMAWDEYKYRFATRGSGVNK